MTATRTQVYLTQAQRDRIDQRARAHGLTMAEVIRRALDEYLGEDSDARAALAATFGADASLVVPSREEWERG